MPLRWQSSPFATLADFIWGTGASCAKRSFGWYKLSVRQEALLAHPSRCASKPFMGRYCLLVSKHVCPNGSFCSASEISDSGRRALMLGLPVAMLGLSPD